MGGGLNWVVLNWWGEWTFRITKSLWSVCVFGFRFSFSSSLLRFSAEIGPPTLATGM